VELAMWILVGIVAALGFVVSVPVLVVGIWFVVITVILGLADGTLWLLDQGWKKKREATPQPLRLVRAPSFP
jgi:fatty acid desaturase